MTIYFLKLKCIFVQRETWKCLLSEDYSDFDKLQQIVKEKVPYDVR